MGVREQGRVGLSAASLATVIACSAFAAIAGCSGGGSSSDPPDGGRAPADATIDTSEAPPADDSGPIGAPDTAEEAADAGSPCADDAGIPDDLACTGLYADWASKTVSPDVSSYTPSVVLWSDGAVKSRWIYLPKGAQIDTSDMDDWTFPVGTKIWKEFVVGDNRIETRLISKNGDATWSYVVYAWTADQSAAQRIYAGKANALNSGYDIPAVSTCSTCHNGRKDKVLGFEVIGLGLSGAQGLTLSKLVAAGSLTKAPLRTIAIPEDQTQKAAAALGWLHANCGTACHNANPMANAQGTDLYMKLRTAQLFADGGLANVTDLDTYQTTVGITAHLTAQGMTWQRIVLGKSSQSLLPQMDMARGSASPFKQMPPLLSNVPDMAGVALVTGWIDAL